MVTDPSPRGERRLRVAIGAAACGPGDEPEANAGWEFASAAARHHDVWVFTRPRLAPAIDAALATDPDLASHLTVVHHDLPAWVQRLRRGPGSLYWYYACWQWTLGRRVEALHREQPFDVLHHVSFANDWLPTALTAVRDVPLVWGPVGGASRVPLRRLHRHLGVRGTATEVIRTVLTAIPRRIWGDRIARRAALVVAQNPDVADRFSSSGPVEVEPNAALDPIVPRSVESGDRPDRRDDAHREAVFVGRLLAWKGARLAITALARPAAADWHLRIFGDGYERAALERLSTRLGVDDRVTFVGHRPREEVLAAFEQADAMLFPSMHDQAGWVAAEASSLGCPVVCLPLGGPPTLAERNAFVASLDGDVATNLAEQLAEAGARGGTRHNRWSRERLPALVDRWYREVTT